MLQGLRSLFAERHDSNRRIQIDLWIALLLVAAAVAWSALTGKDLNWDQLNYHFYLGYSLLNNRLGRDFVAANGQSYLNPLAYVPFYWMVAHGWHSLLIASVLAAFHSLNIVLTYFIAKAVLLAHKDGSKLIAFLGAGLAYLSPIFLTTVGTTFSDVSTAVFVLSALLLALQSDPEQRWWSNRTLFAGLCFGMGCGLKLSNLVFGPAFAVMLIWLHPSVRRAFRAWLLFGIGSAAGILATHGYWSWRLWRTFGDSSSSMVSILLGSPDIPSSSAFLPERFLPHTVLDAVLLPFRIVELRSWIYIESVAPDLRLAAAVLLLLAGAGAWFVRRRTAALTTGLSGKPGALLIFFLLALVLWICTSANGRYGIVVSILCGPVLAMLMQFLLQRQAVTVCSLVALAALQVGHLHNGQLRWTGEKWTKTWYEASVPERLHEEPYLYISVGGNSNSYAAAFLAPGSAFTNPVGQLSFDFGGPGGRRLQALLDEYSGRVRILARARSAQEDETFSQWLSSADNVIARFGFAVDPRDCLTLTTMGPYWRLGDSFSEHTQSYNHLRTCALVSRPYQRAAERERVHKVVQMINTWCPKLFKMPDGVVEQTPHGWYVTYVSTGTTLLVNGDRIYATQPHTSVDLYLGTLEYWETGQRPDCTAFPERLRTKYTF